MPKDVRAPRARKGMPRAGRWGLAAVVAAAVLAGCGGGGDSNGNGNASRVQNCDLNTRKAELSDYFNEWYFWTAVSPKPAPTGSHSLATYFDALLYPGGSNGFPADRWSYYEATESFNRFFGDGRTLGFGVAVAGLEVQGRPELPLYVRYVDPRSPAASAGVVRGDRVLSVNGRPVSELITTADFSALTPSASGQSLRLELVSTSGSSRTVTLQSASYDLVPVPTQQVLTSPSGRRVGYVLVKDMVSQAVSPATEAFAGFRSAGVTELVVDLRYNGGGLVSVARDLASLVGGSRSSGRTYSALRYNSKRASQNDFTYTFNDPAQATGLQRVYILAGQRLLGQRATGQRAEALRRRGAGGRHHLRQAGGLPAAR